MSRIEAAFMDVGRLDRMASGDSWLHRLDPRAKILTAAVFVVAVVSFPKHELSALAPFALFPVFLAAAGRVPFGYVAKRLVAVSPFALLVAMWNPIFDREIILRLGGLGVSGGWVSFLSLMARFALTVGAAFALIAVTSFQGLCLGLQRLGMPQAMTVQLLFLYRYLFVLGEEALHMSRARALRTFGKRGGELKIFAHVVGHLLLRTLDRAQRIYQAMLSRGFDGEVRILREVRFGGGEIAFTLGWSLVFLAFRLVNLPRLLGALFTGS